MTDPSVVSMASALLLSEGLGRARLSRALHYFGGVENAFEQLRSGAAGELSTVGDRLGNDRARSIATSLRKLSVDDICRVAERLGIGLVYEGSPEYPSLLSEVESRPPFLFYRGVGELLSAPAVAIVGTRRATLSGIDVARRIAREVSEKRVTVVSGLATGIDAAAHSGGLEGEGSSIAVLGSGVDVAYPQQNRPIYERLIAEGLVISEFALGSPPERYRFPTRNRTISGISLGVVVVEAFSQGGALSSAAAAREQDRDVMAVPGSVESPASDGTFALIRDGAHAVASGSDVLGVVGLFRSPSRGREVIQPLGLSETARQVCDLLGDRLERSAMEISRPLGIGFLETVEALDELVARGLVELVAPGQYRAATR